MDQEVKGVAEMDQESKEVAEMGQELEEVAEMGWGLMEVAEMGWGLMEEKRRIEGVLLLYLKTEISLKFQLDWSLQSFLVLVVTMVVFLEGVVAEEGVVAKVKGQVYQEEEEGCQVQVDPAVEEGMMDLYLEETCFPHRRILQSFEWLAFGYTRQAFLQA